MLDEDKPKPHRILELHKQIAELQEELDELLTAELVFSAPLKKRVRRTKEQIAADRAKLPQAAL